MSLFFFVHASGITLTRPLRDAHMQYLGRFKRIFYNSLLVGKSHVCIKNNNELIYWWKLCDILFLYAVDLYCSPKIMKNISVSHTAAHCGTYSFIAKSLLFCLKMSPKKLTAITFYGAILRKTDATEHVKERNSIYSFTSLVCCISRPLDSYTWAISGSVKPKRIRTLINNNIQ